MHLTQFFSLFLSGKHIFSWLIYTVTCLVLSSFSRFRYCCFHISFSYTFEEMYIEKVCLSFKIRGSKEIRKLPIDLYSHHNWQLSQLHHVDFHPVLLRQNNRSMQSCLADHFTLAALCYLLILAPSLLSIAFHLSFIFLSHVHATIFLLSVFSFTNMIWEAIYLSSGGQCVAPCTLI